MPEPEQKPDGPKALTNIPDGIHWAATDEPEPDTDYQQEFDELDQIAIDNFLDILAEVAMDIATRRITQDQRENDL